MLWHKIFTALKMEAVSEWRNKTAISGLFVYVASASYLVYIIFNGKITTPTYIATFWLLVLFVTINAVGKSMSHNLNEQYYYLRQHISPTLLIVSKLIYNAFIILCTTILILSLFQLFYPGAISNPFRYILIAVLGAYGLSNIFTLLSAISAGSHNVSLVAILGFPVVLPLLLLIVRLSGFADFMPDEKDYLFNLYAIIILDIITITLAIILFTFLWKE